MRKLDKGQIMARIKRAKVPFPTDQEMTDVAKRQHEVSGFSAIYHGPLLFLILDCDNRDIATVSMSTIDADYLLRHVELVLRGDESAPTFGSPTKWAKSDVPAAYGSLFKSS